MALASYLTTSIEGAISSRQGGTIKNYFTGLEQKIYK